MLSDLNILLGVTGGIAAYKAVDLASKLTQAGALVDVIMTVAATSPGFCIVGDFFNRGQ